MGSGISLSKNQIIDIIRRTIKEEYDAIELNKPNSIDGYLVYYDFSDEMKYIKKLKELNNFLNKI